MRDLKDGDAAIAVWGIKESRKNENLKIEGNHVSKWLRCSCAGPCLVRLRLFLPVTRVFSCYCCLFGGQALGCCKAAGEKIDWKTKLNEGGGKSNYMYLGLCSLELTWLNCQRRSCIIFRWYGKHIFTKNNSHYIFFIKLANWKAVSNLML